MPQGDPRAAAPASRTCSTCPIPLGDLPEDARAWERGVDELAAEDAEVADYVRSLEEAQGHRRRCPRPPATRSPGSSSATCAAAGTNRRAADSTCLIPVWSGYDRYPGRRARAGAARARSRWATPAPAAPWRARPCSAARYGVSRVTVRRALEVLRDQGLVESRRGAGWFVTGRRSTSGWRSAPSGTPRPRSPSPASRRRRRCAWPSGSSRPPSAVADAPRPRRRGRGAALPVGAHRRRPAAGPRPRVGAGRPGRPAEPGRRARRPASGRRLRRDGHRDRRRCGSRSPPPWPATDDAELLEVAAGHARCSLVRRLAAGRRPAGPLALSDHRYLAHRFSLEVEFRGWSQRPPPPSRPACAAPPTDASTVTDQRRPHR